MNKIVSLLGLARRAGKLVFGYDAVVGSIKEEKAKLLLIACDMSPKTKKNVKFEADKFGISLFELPCDIEEITAGIGKKAGVVAITDENFAQGIKSIVSTDERKIT